MIRRPPRSTRTDTLFPYTTLFRSVRNREFVHTPRLVSRPLDRTDDRVADRFGYLGDLLGVEIEAERILPRHQPLLRRFIGQVKLPRSEERRVGHECVSPCTYRCSP